MVFPQITIFLLKKNTGEEADFMFIVPDGMPFWGLGENEPLIILFLPDYLTQ